jgi:hypothetical protein
MWKEVENYKIVIFFLLQNVHVDICDQENGWCRTNSR